MKKQFYSIAIATLALGMTACGGKKDGNAEEAQLTENDEALPPVAVTYSPDASADEFAEYIVFSQSADSLIHDTSWSSSLKLNIYPKVIGSLDPSVEIKPQEAVVYDKAGNELTRLYCMGGWTDLNKALHEGDVSFDSYLSFSSSPDKEEIAKIMSDAATYSITAKLEDVSEPDDSSSSSSSSYGDSEVDKDAVKAFVNSDGFKKFVKNANSGDIDRIIEAMEWQNSQRESLKPKVRSLDKTAIAKSIEIDKASEKAAGKYDCYSLGGIIDSMSDKLSDSQRTAYNSACAVVLYYTADDDSSDYNNIYRKLRYGL